MVVKATLNMKISNEMWVAMSFEQIIDDEEEARKAGADSNVVFNSWLEGFGEPK